MDKAIVRLIRRLMDRPPERHPYTTGLPDRDALGRVLHDACPQALVPATHWTALTDPEHEAWRVLADAAFRWCAPTPTDTLLAKSNDQYRAMLAMMDKLFGPYARHLDGCAQTPCTCGFAALLDDMP